MRSNVYLDPDQDANVLRSLQQESCLEQLVGAEELKGDPLLAVYPQAIPFAESMLNGRWILPSMSI